MRERALRGMLLQPAKYFDESYNSPHALSSLLTTHPPRLRAVVARGLDTATYSLAAIAAAVATALSASPQMGLLMAACFPVLLLVQLASAWLQRAYEERFEEAIRQANRVRHTGPFPFLSLPLFSPT